MTTRRLLTTFLTCLMALSLMGCAKTNEVVAPVQEEQASEPQAPAEPVPAVWADEIGKAQGTPEPADAMKLNDAVVGWLTNANGYYDWTRDKPEAFSIAAINLKSLVSPEQYQEILAAKNPLSGQTMEEMWTAVIDVPVEQRTDRSGIAAGSVDMGQFDKTDISTGRKWTKYDAVTSKGKYPNFCFVKCQVIDESGEKTGETVGVSHPFAVDTATGIVTFAPYVYLYDKSAQSFTYEKQVDWLN